MSLYEAGFNLPPGVTGNEPALTGEDAGDCISCGEGLKRQECPASQRACGHHCDHSWAHERCCWCGREWGE